jgi:hydroxyacylglutathione hydrolase
MRIDDDLYIVGSGDYGFNISHSLDCNVYVLDTGAGLWMLDAGFDDADRVARNMRDDGLDPLQVRALFVTHYHADHAGAVAAWRARLGPGLVVAMADDAAPAVRAGEEEVIGL